MRIIFNIEPDFLTISSGIEFLPTPTTGRVERTVHLPLHMGMGMGGKPWQFWWRAMESMMIYDVQPPKICC